MSVLSDSASFTRFVETVGRPLRQALMAAYGRDVGDEATSEAMVYAWENWTRIDEMANPAGYLFRVGQSRAKALLRGRGLPFGPSRPTDGVYWFEPRLWSALESLSRRQRAAVVLVYGFEWTVTEVAEMWDVGFSTVQAHLDRGMAKLRRRLKVDS